MQQQQIIGILNKFGFIDFAFISARDIVTAQRVRAKCTFGCPNYGCGTCPPHTPDLRECREFFSEYTDAIIIRLKIKNTDTDELNSTYRRISADLLAVERALLSIGYPFAFAFNHSNCQICEEGTCACINGNRSNCVNKLDSRPGPTAFAVDMSATAQSANFDVRFSNKDSNYFDKFALIMLK